MARLWSKISASKPVRIAGKIIFRGFLVFYTVVFLFLFLVFIFAAYLRFFVHDIPPFDDSAMYVKAPDVPENQNAWLQMTRVMLTHDDIEPHSDIPHYPESIFISRYSEASTTAYIENHPEIIDLLRHKYSEQFAILDHAATLPYSRRVPPPGKSLILPEYSSLLELISFRMRIARDDYEHGSMNEAMKAIYNTLELGRILEVNDGGTSLVEYSFAAPVTYLALYELHRMLANGYLPNGDIAAVNHYLAKFKTNTQALQNAFKNEYLIQKSILINTSMLTGIRKDESFLEVIKWIGTPDSFFNVGLDNDFIRSLFFRENIILKYHYDRYSSEIQRAGRAWIDIAPQTDPEQNGCMKICPPIIPINSKMLSHILKGDVYNYVFSFWESSFDNVFIRRLDIDFLLDAVRLQTAIMAYKKENGGVLPPSLDSLVPKYIEAVPADAFDKNPIRYNRERGVVYSVGEDLVDNGGTAEAEFSGERISYPRKIIPNDIVVEINFWNR